MENKTSKYFKYAFGEIILVMIGILLALQVNNWNEKRISSNQEIILLNSLKREFTENQEILSSEITRHAHVLRLVKELNTLISPNPKEIDDNKLDSLMFGLGWLPEYNPIDGVINSIISSGEISLIKDDKLSSKLSSWNGFLNLYKTNYSWSERDVFEHILPYIKEMYPFKRTLKYFGNEIKADSEFKYSKDKLLSNIGFESVVSNRLIDARDLLNSAKELFDFQTEVLNLIEKELKK